MDKKILRIWEDDLPHEVMKKVVEALSGFDIFVEKLDTLKTDDKFELYIYELSKAEPEKQV